MKPDYTALDAAILKHIRSGSPCHPMHAKACREVSQMLWPGWAHHTERIHNRLQALRKAGKIRHRRSAGHGWIVVEEPPNA